MGRAEAKTKPAHPPARRDGGNRSEDFACGNKNTEFIAPCGCLELKSRLCWNDLIGKILHVPEQFVLQNAPVTRVENAPGLRLIVGKQTHLNLRVRPVERRPGFSRLQTKSLHARNELA